MLIDWFTVSAQVINFLILVWLMKHFLYQPILNAIDERETKIALELATVADKKVDAQREKEQYQEKNTLFEQQREELMTSAKKEVSSERERLLSELKTEVESKRKAQSSVFIKEHEKLAAELSKRIQEETLAMTTKVLTELSGVDLETPMVDVFIKNLSALSGEDKKLIQDGSHDENSRFIFSTVTDLSDEQRNKLMSLVNDIFDNEPHIEFEIKPDLLCGIEFTVNGHKLDWSIKTYMENLEKSLADLIVTDAQVLNDGSQKHHE